MPELRKDPIVGRWVIISADRGKRPSDWDSVRDTSKNVGSFCPFCPGNEDKTPPEVYAVRTNGGSSEWKLRVVPNKFPALQIEGELVRKGEGIYDWMSGIGAHEVLIETADHSLELPDFSPSHIESILQIFKARIEDLRNDTRFKYIQIFKNHGVAAGASLEHSHSQLIATPILPKRVVEELEGAKKHFELKERCIFCDIINQERGFGKRIIQETDEFLAIAPFAARFPYEMWILPKRHYSHYENMEIGLYLKLAEILKDALLRVNKVLDSPPYNFVIHTSPIQEPATPDYHWHIEIIPKLTKIAGFEWGTGFYINAVAPEQSAAHYREVGI
ncbi:MAG: galactose-1-phosphate uridylyltransferase [Deferribacteres bacterium]|nr:galactose-1-phosphate uridylyltransferase [candidate division KSB1 bacterium]MCB9510255.1 galactose-1-phosphate uridylyltransferase [Deferribacteres bacterium]